MEEEEGAVATWSEEAVGGGELAASWASTAGSRGAERGRGGGSGRMGRGGVAAGPA
jgi:hypothetical protein